MTRVVVDAAIRSQLHGMSELLELCDESGQTLGYFHPAVRSGNVEGTRVQSPFGEEEIRRRLQEHGGRPLSDILEDLRRL